VVNNLETLNRQSDDQDPSSDQTRRVAEYVFEVDYNDPDSEYPNGTPHTEE
jgi:hypothetical protein